MPKPAKPPSANLPTPLGYVPGQPASSHEGVPVIPVEEEQPQAPQQQQQAQAEAVHDEDDEDAVADGIVYLSPCAMLSRTPSTEIQSLDSENPQDTGLTFRKDRLG